MGKARILAVRAAKLAATAMLVLLLIYAVVFAIWLFMTTHRAIYYAILLVDSVGFGFSLMWLRDCYEDLREYC